MLFQIHLVSKLRRNPRFPSSLRAYKWGLLLVSLLQVRYKLFFRERVRSSGTGMRRRENSPEENGDNSSKPPAEAFDLPTPSPWSLEVDSGTKGGYPAKFPGIFAWCSGALSAGPLDRQIYRRRERRRAASCQSFFRSSAGETFVREACAGSKTSRASANKMSDNKC